MNIIHRITPGLFPEFTAGIFSPPADYIPVFFSNLAFIIKTVQNKKRQNIIDFFRSYIIIISGLTKPLGLIIFTNFKDKIRNKGKCLRINFKNFRYRKSKPLVGNLNIKRQKLERGFSIHNAFIRSVRNSTAVHVNIIHKLRTSTLNTIRNNFAGNIINKFYFIE